MVNKCDYLVVVCSLACIVILQMLEMLTQSITSVTKQQAILVVDDSSVLRCAYKQVMESWGYKVDVAEDGLKAIELLKATSYHLVVTDYEMPNCDGIEFFLRAQDEIGEKVPPPFILITGTPLELLADNLTGFALALKKPMGLKALRGAIDDVLSPLPS